MFGAVQFGLLAACIVLFVPMRMAGWHLSRNKILFFSCVLFITLAAVVHLMPYIPTISNLVLPSYRPIGGEYSLYRDSCVSFLHSVMYNYDRECDQVENCKNKSWNWVGSGQVNECGFQKLKKSDASVLLNGSWVIVAGDSQARLLLVSLLGLVMDSVEIERINGDLYKRHGNFSLVLDEIGMKLDFIWAPFVKNLTDFTINLRRNGILPDVMIMGAGLWDMLYINEPFEYELSLSRLRDSTLALLPVSSDLDQTNGVISESKSRFVHLFWLGIPTLVNSMLKTEAKREKMTDSMCNSFEDSIAKSKLLRESGGPYMKLDVRLLSDLCGVQCTSDGMHYDGIVYEAAVQIMLNALLIESNQKL